MHAQLGHHRMRPVSSGGKGLNGFLGGDSNHSLIRRWLHMSNTKDLVTPSLEFAESMTELCDGGRMVEAQRAAIPRVAARSKISNHLRPTSDDIKHVPGVQI